MQYSKSEINTISNAVYDASNILDTAFYLLVAFREKYFDPTDHAELILDAQHRPEILDSQIDAVQNLLRMVMVELDVFTNPDSYVEQAFLSDVAKKEHPHSNGLNSDFLLMNPRGELHALRFSFSIRHRPQLAAPLASEGQPTHTAPLGKPHTFYLFVACGTRDTVHLGFPRW